MRIMWEQEFIVAYAYDWLTIEPSNIADNPIYGDRCLYSQYHEGLAHYNRSDEPIKDGSIISYNNRWWCSVKATNVREALNKAFDKFNAYWDTH